MTAYHALIAAPLTFQCTIATSTFIDTSWQASPVALFTTGFVDTTVATDTSAGIVAASPVISVLLSQVLPLTPAL